VRDNREAVFKQLKKTSPVVIFMAVLLFLGIGYSIYKAAGSFSTKVDSPAYDRTPSDSIVAPEIETVIPQNDPVAIRTEREGFRLSDRAIFDIHAGTLRIARALQSGKFTESFLRELGYPPKDIAKSVRRMDKIFASAPMDERAKTLISIQNENSGVIFAQSSIEFQFAGSGGAFSAEIYIGWVPTNRGWLPVAFSESSL
jgi:hypothetical protein